MKYPTDIARSCSELFRRMLSAVRAGSDDGGCSLISCYTGSHIQPMRMSVKIFEIAAVRSSFPRLKSHRGRCLNVKLGVR